MLLSTFTSCREESIVSTDETLKVTSELATLVQQVSIKDGSGDNIVDKANDEARRVYITITHKHN